MKIYDDISKYGVIQEIDRICGSNANNYPIRDKIARINDALSQYFKLAFKVDGRWNFDDVNETTPPIDTQDISGTNRYKFSDFTEKIASLVKLEILDSSGNGLPLIPEKFTSLGLITGNASGKISGLASDTFQELYVNASSGTPTHYCKYGDFIYLRPKPNYSYASGLIAYFNRPLTKHELVTVTISNANPAVLTATAHGLVANDVILLVSDGTVPTGLAHNTVYYVVATVADDTFSVAATKGGSAIATTSAGSGLHSFLKLSGTPAIPEDYHPFLARYASIPFLIDNNKEQYNIQLGLLQKDEEDIKSYFSSRDEDMKKRMTPNIEDVE